MRRITAVVLALIALAYVSSIAWALSAGTNISLVNGEIAVVGPPSATNLTTNGVLLGNGTSAITATTACTNTGHVLIGGSPPACGAITDSLVPDDITVDLADKATALAANGANCSAGEYPLGVDESGAAEDCTPVPVSVLTGTSVTDLTTNQTIYMGGGTADTTKARACVPVPAGTWGNLRCRQATAAGTSNDVTCTVHRGTCGSETDAATTCTITGGGSAASCADTSNTTTTTAGQCLCVKGTTPAALTNSQYILWSLERLS